MTSIMKTTTLVIVSLLLWSCSSTHLVETWKNPDIHHYEPYKVLIVGLTSDEAARLQFESKLKKEFELRGYEAVMSREVFDQKSTTVGITEVELITFEKQLAKDGFDTILMTKIIGVDDRVAYRNNYKSYDNTYRKFRDDYLMYQDIYYNPDYYDNYTIYHAETTMYCICKTKDRDILWKGYINITDPRSIKKTVDDYVNLALQVLEDAQLIRTKMIGLKVN